MRSIKFIMVSLFAIIANSTMGQITYLEEYTGSYLNETEHANWIKKKYTKYIDAAKQGDAIAQLCIAEVYMDDSENVLGSIDSNWNMVVFWYRKAAEQGNAVGQFWLGTFYENGTNVTQNSKEAAIWYRKAAEQGLGNGQFALAELYEKGHGVSKNYDEALKWYRLAAVEDYPDANKKVLELEQKIRQREDILLAEKSRKEKMEQSSQNIVQQPQKQAQGSSQKVYSEVDRNIPVNNIPNKKMFAIIIGNEKYTDEEFVPYAGADAKIFKDYCRQTLGISENHIRFVTNAGYNDIRKAINWLRQGLEAYSGEGSVIFYYAGHGIPDEAEKTAYLLPVDGIGNDVGSAYSLEKLYQALGDMPAKSIIVFLDACFSGAKRDGGMMASARGVAIKTKAEEPKGKMVVFTAAQGDETAYPYRSQKHGMFTYYLLRKLQETKGDVTLGVLADYITREVKRQSFDENSRSQTPSIKASSSIGESWRNLKLK
jgi:FOG: TPR repeat, SEL1 subfamily